MMLDQNKLKNAVDLFSKNEYWKKYYDEAPSENCKKVIELDFYYSCYFWKMDEEEKQEIFRLTKKYEEDYQIADWKHMLKYCGHNPKVTWYKNKIKELEAAQANKA